MIKPILLIRYTHAKSTQDIDMVAPTADKTTCCLIQEDLKYASQGIACINRKFNFNSPIILPSLISFFLQSS